MSLTKNIQIGDKTYTFATTTSELTNDSNFISQLKTLNGTTLIGEGNVNGLDEYCVTNKEDMAKAMARVKNNDYNFRLYTDIDASIIEIGNEREYALIVVKYSTDLGGFMAIFINNLVDNELGFVADAYTILESDLESEDEFNPEVTQFPLAFKDDIPTKISDLENDLPTETWTFTLEDGTTVDKTIYLKEE